MGKTIAQELFTIAEAQGGTAKGYPRTIAGAVDALTDALAGSDVDSGRTIAEAVAVMGEYIGGGGGVSLGNCAQLNAVGFSGDEWVDGYIGGTKCALVIPNGSGQLAGGMSAELWDESIEELGTVSAVTVAGHVPGETPQEVAFTDFTAVIDEDWECLKISFTMPNIAKSSQGGVGLIRFTYSDK